MGIHPRAGETWTYYFLLPCFNDSQPVGKSIELGGHSGKAVGRVFGENFAGFDVVFNVYDQITCGLISLLKIGPKFVDFVSSQEGQG